MSIQIGPRIVSDSSLLLYLNAGYAGSYSGTGTTWYDMSPSLNHVTIGATYDSRGYFDFNGYQSGSLTNAITLPSTFTVDVLLQSYKLTQGSGILNSATADTLLNPLEAYGGQIRSSTGGNSTRWAYGPISTFTIQKNTWYNFAITNDSDVYKVYKNGIYMGSSGYIGESLSVPNSYTPYENMAKIGARGWGTPGTYFSGSLAILRVYNRVLSDAEIAQNHAAFRK